MSSVNMRNKGLFVLLALALLVLLYLIYTGGGRSDRRRKYVDETVKISQLLSAAIILAEAGGDKIVEIRKLDDKQLGQLSKGTTKEGRDEYVTTGDQMSHQIITAGFRNLWPNLNLRSEESDHGSPQKQITSGGVMDLTNSEIFAVTNRDEAVAMDQVAVWVDPLDATQEYTEGGKEPELLKYVTVMVCIAVRGKPIAGVIHEPYSANPRTGITGVTKWAWVGHGVSKTLQREIVPAGTESNPKSMKIIASRSHAGDVFSVADSTFGKTLNLEKVVAAGSGFKTIQVAERRADLYLHTTAIKKWDICAGDAVLRSLGGKMTTLKGAEIDYGLEGNPKNSDGIVAAATEDKHSQYLKMLRTRKSS